MGDADGAGAPLPRQASSVTRYSLRAQLFLASYAPLFAILAIRFEGLVLEAVCGGLAGLGIGLAAWLTYRAARKKSPTTVTLDAVEDEGAEVSGYLATYLLPLLVVPQPTIRDLTGYLVYLAVALLV